MQPSSNWGNDGRYAGGLNTRGVDISDIDYTNFPPFIYSSHATAPEQKEFIAWFYNDTFSINSPIDDWSVAYTAVDNPDLSMNNIGVFLDDPDTPEYTTNNTQYQKIAFYSSITYNLTRAAYGLTSLGAYRRFYGLPYSNNYYNWSPDCHTNTYAGSAYNFMHDANYQGYAVMYKSFGIKSLFLEIHVKPYHLQGTVINPDLTLQEYAALPQQTRDDNPIGAAYAQVYIRADATGNYATSSHDYGDIQAINALGLSDGTNTIYNYFSGVQIQGVTPKIILPLWGFSNAGMALMANYISHVIADNNGELFYGYDKIDGSVLDSHETYYYCYKYMNGTDENIEYLRKCCAAYGLFFCDKVLTSDLVDLSSSSAENTRWTHDEMHLGIIESDGYTRGNYTSGADNADQAQFNWSDSTDSTYDPSVTPIPTENEYSRQTNWNLVGDLSTLTKRYVMTGAAVQHLGRELWTISSDLIDDGQGGVDYNNLNDKMLDSFLTQNPIDCIVDLRRYPMEIPKADACLIKLGKYETIVGGYTMEKTVYNYLFELRQPIFPLFGDSFIDYEPYTHFELYIPFCGTVSIEPADILGRKLAVQLVVDFTTGTCTAYVMSDNLVIKSAQGQIAIDIPVSGIQSVTAASQISNAIIDARVAKAGEIGAVGNLASVSGITKMLTNPFQTGAQISQAQWQQDRADYNLTHQNIPPHTIGAASSAASWAIDLNCRLIIYYPTGEVIREANPPEFILQKLAEYGHTTGFSCCMTGQLKEFLGLTVGINADLNGIRTNNGIRPATLQELQLLEAALEEGVIL